MIPSPSHPWSPWRPLAAIGWLGFVILLGGAATLYGLALRYDRHQAEACRLRWHTVKTPADSVRVAGDCGMLR